MSQPGGSPARRRRSRLDALLLLSALGMLFARISASAPTAPLAAGGATVDHVVVGIGDLDAGIRTVADTAGVAPVRGGQHPGRGTQNALLGLGPHTYLELVAPAAPAPPAPPAEGATQEPRQMAELRALPQPTPIGWAVGARDLDATVSRLRAAGFQLGPAAPGSRVRPDGQVLHWRTAVLLDLPEGVTPFLIEWSSSTPHPATTSPGGCTLRSLEIQTPQTPDAEKLARLVQELGLGATVAVRQGAAARLGVALDCPRGRVVLPAPASGPPRPTP